MKKLSKKFNLTKLKIYLFRLKIKKALKKSLHLKRACSSVVERYVDIVEVISSILSCPPFFLKNSFVLYVY